MPKPSAFQRLVASEFKGDKLKVHFQGERVIIRQPYFYPLEMELIPWGLAIQKRLPAGRVIRMQDHYVAFPQESYYLAEVEDL